MLYVLGRAIIFAPKAIKALERIDGATRERIKAKVRQLADSPESLANNIRPLKGGEGLWRLRVGDWRVIYSETLVVLTIVRVSPRSSAYD